MSRKRCTKCHVVKTISAYYFRHKRNHYQSICKECAKSATKAWGVANKEKKKQYNSENWRKWDDRERKAEQRQFRRVTPHGRTKEVLFNAYERSKRQGLVFSISFNETMKKIENGVCEVTGIAFDFSPNKEKGKRNPYAPSIDRVDNNAGYTCENSRCVITAVNFAKNEHSELDFIAMCVAVAERHADDPAVIARLKELRGG